MTPFVVLAISGAAATADAWNLTCDAPLHEFTVATSAILLGYAVNGAILFRQRDRKLSRTILALIIVTVVAGYSVR